MTLDYKLLKKNAPKIWEKTIGQRIFRLTHDLEQLKEQYKSETDQVKRGEIELKGKALKRELLQYE